MKKVLWVSLFAVCLAFTACHRKKPDSNVLTVGVISGPEAVLAETAGKVALKHYGLHVNVVTFTDYNMPNQALEDKEITVNVFQHYPFLLSQIRLHGYAFSPVGDTFVYPMGLYSDKLHALSALASGNKVAIPNDPSNEARALLLLEKAGLLTLKPKAGVNATTNDIVDNPKKLNIIEMDAAQLPRALADVSVAAINTNYAKAAGLSLSQALFSEDGHSPYVNLIVARATDRNDKNIEDYVAAYQSPQVVAEAKKLFGDGAIPGFKVVKDE